MSSGTTLLSVYINPLVPEAELELQAQSSLIDREKILYDQLNNVLTTRMGKVSFESHQECLARGLRTGNAGTFGLALQYPDIRNQIVDWTEANCGQLFYAPQNVPDTFEKQSRLPDWIPANCKVCKVVAQRMLSLIKRSAMYSRLNSTVHEIIQKQWRQMIRHIRDEVSSHIKMDDIVARLKECHAQASLDSPFHEIQERALMPYGFSLDCQPLSPCRIAYTPTPGRSDDMVVVSAKAIMETTQKLAALRSVKSSTDKFLSFMLNANIVFTAFQMFLIMAFNNAETCPRYFPLALDMQTLKELVNSWLPASGYYNKLYYKVVLQGFVGLATLPLVELETSFANDVLGALGIISIIWGFVKVVQFLGTFQEESKATTVFKMVHEIWTIMRSTDVPTEADDPDLENSNNKDMNMVSEPLRSESPQATPIQGHQTTSSSPENRAHRNFSSTTLREDIQAELQNLRNERIASSSDEFESDTDSDTDTEDEDDEISIDIDIDGNDEIDGNSEQVFTPSESSSSSDSSDSDWSVLTI